MSAPERKPVSFFVNGAIALVAVFLVTFVMESGPEVTGIRALIGVGLGIIVLKVVLRRYNIEFPPRRRR